jgi:hypothetical protein
MNNKSLFFFSVIFLSLFSCVQDENNKELYTYKLDVENSLKNGIPNFTVEDTIKFSLSFSLKDKQSENLIINVAENIHFKAYQGQEVIAQKLYGNIYNTSKNVTENQLPILPYTKRYNFSIDSDKLTSETIRFEVFKSVPRKDVEEPIIKIFYTTTILEKGEQSEEVENKNELLFTESKLPIIKISTKENLSDEDKIVVDYAVINNKGTNKLNDKALIAGKAKIKIRGSSSKLLPKQSYLFKTYDDSLKANELPLLGLPEGHDWVFYAPFTDQSLMRNVLSYKLHREMGNYSPRTKYFHLVINNDYRGIYILTERISRDKNRLNITKLKKKETNQEDITGGYIVKLDKGKGEAWKSPYASKIDSGFGKWFIYVYPKSQDLNQEKRDYIKNYITDFEKALLNGGNWRDYIDEKSFIDHMIMVELTKNVDGYRLSTFYSKDRGQKLKAEPLWDFNLTFGLTSYYDGYKTEGLMYLDEASPFWWKYLLKDDQFNRNFKKRWTELRKTIFSDESIINYINEEQQILQGEISYNTHKWLFYKEPSNWRKQTQLNFEKSVEYLNKWTLERLHYLDQEFAKL